MRFGALGCLLALAAASCGGQTTQRFGDDAGPDAAAPAGSGGAPDSDAALPDAAAVQDVASDYVDPGCPAVDPPPAQRQCDPLAEVTGCEPGLACYPFVDHPFGEGCNVQRFGTLCTAAGTGTQGDRCGDGFGFCAEGFLCVIGTRAGARCARLCDVNTPNACPSGLICGDTDIEGYGVCA